MERTSTSLNYILFVCLYLLTGGAQAITLQLEESGSDLLISGGLLGTDTPYALRGRFTLDLLPATTGMELHFADIDVTATALDGSGMSASWFPLTFAASSQDGVNFSATMEDNLNYYLRSYSGSFDGNLLLLSGSEVPMPILADATTSTYSLQARVVPLPASLWLLMSGVLVLLGMVRSKHGSQRW